MTHKLLAVLVAAGTACLAGCGTITMVDVLFETMIGS